jgi:hypothetical protein
MNPTIEKEKPCECGGVIQHFGNVSRCSQCGRQPGVAYHGSTCPCGCDPQLSVRFAHGMHCNACGKDWLV